MNVVTTTNPHTLHTTVRSKKMVSSDEDEEYRSRRFPVSSRMIRPYRICLGSGTGSGSPAPLVYQCVHQLCHMIQKGVSPASQICELPANLLDLLSDTFMVNCRTVYDRRHVDRNRAALFHTLLRARHPCKIWTNLVLPSFLKPGHWSASVFHVFATRSHGYEVAAGHVVSITLGSVLISPDYDEPDEVVWKKELHKFVSAFPKVVSVTLKGDFCDDEVMDLLGRSAAGTRLQEVKIIQKVPSQGLSDEGMMDLVEHCGSLTSLDIRDCSSPGITANSLLHLNTLPYLHELHIQLHHFAFAEFFRSRYPDLATRGNAVRSIHLCFPEAPWLDEDLQDLIVHLGDLLHQFFPGLRRLCLRSILFRLLAELNMPMQRDTVVGVDTFQFDDLDALAAVAPSLEWLHLTDPKFNARLLSAFAQLTVVHFKDADAGISFDLMGQVMQNAKSLACLVVEAAAIHDISDQRLEQVLLHNAHLHTSLTHFSLSAYRIKVGLTEVGLRHLFRLCKKLVSLENIAYWNISRLINPNDLCPPHRQDVRVQSAVFLPDKILPVP